MINRIPVKYNIDLCWNGCKESASDFFVVIKNKGKYRNQKSNKYNKYGVGFCSKCGKAVKAKMLSRHSQYSDTQYISVQSKEEVLIYQIMEE